MGNGKDKVQSTWWTKGHGTFGAHEEGGLIKAHAPPIKKLPTIIR
jgi:hypothetical protein